MGRIYNRNWERYYLVDLGVDATLVSEQMSTKFGFED